MKKLVHFYQASNFYKADFQMGFIQTVDILSPLDTLTNDLLSLKRRSIVAGKMPLKERKLWMAKEDKSF